ncbi:MAG: M56 family metallopeptidase [Terracidiphilus sp.]|jgi:beta-lactamase regulating signal transducer with metallopeptidase domain
MISAACSILLGAALRALLAACAVWTGLHLLRVKNVRAQKAAWSVLLVAALAMPLLVLGHWFPVWAEIRVPILSWPAAVPLTPASAQASTLATLPMPAAVPPSHSAPVATNANIAPEAAISEFEVSRETAVETASAPSRATDTAPVPSKPVPVTREIEPPKATRTSIPWRAIVLLIYLAVSAAFLLRWIVGFGSSIRLWLLATPVDAADECGLTGALATRASRRISSPVNIGSGIVLPADYSEWETGKLRAVLAHERAHIRQGDFYLQLLAGLYTAFNWFSPLGWWLKHNLSELSEAISDRAALEESASPSAYAQLLLEFAALPRPTVTGVAMAHSSKLSHRIERLLDDSHFKQAFTGTRRALAAALIVPAVLVAATALVRVEAAPLPQSTTSQAAAPQPADPAQAQAPAAAPYTGQSNPPEGVGPASDQAPPSPPGPAPAPKPEDAGPPAPTPMPSARPEPQASPHPQAPPVPPIHVEVHVPPMPPNVGDFAFDFGDQGFGFGGGALAIIGDPGSKPRFFGMWDTDRSAEVEKARKSAHGHFLLFRRDGKSYIVDDPAIVSQAEAMDKAIQLQGEEMRNLGKQMRDLGAQQREAGQLAREAARKAREAAREIPTPDLSKQMAQLNAAVASLQAHQGGTISREQLAELQRDLNELQRQILGAQMKIDVDLNMNGAMAQFNEEQAKFGAEMGKLGAEMGQLSHENHQKMRELLDDSLKNGKARPVE